MNLKAIAQIVLLLASSLVLASVSLAFLSENLKKKTAVLIPVTSPESTIFITSSRMLIGRDHDADVMVIDESVSLKHCEIILKRGRFIVRDLNSQNGTFVNNSPVLESELKDGDILTIGRKNFVFKLG